MITAFFGACGLIATLQEARAETSSQEQGLAIYRDAILPSGKSLTALVAGDIEVSGKQFSCESCHGRSGMGRIEGDYIVPPIAGPILFKDANQPVRSAYDETSLAKLLRSGINSDGQAIDHLMPRFKLSDEEVKILANYLRQLSNKTAPGVDDKQIRLATIISDDVDKALAESVLSVLNTFVEEKNRQTRLEGRRPNRGKKPELRSASLFRNWSLDVWRLTGDPSTWKQQLENYYKAQPVFAVLGGMTNKSWEPIGKFCEQNQIPCMFPSVDISKANKGDYYSYHFSRGIELEADIIANYLEKNKPSKVFQLYCEDYESAATRLSAKLELQSVSQSSMAIDCSHKDSLHLVVDRLSEAQKQAKVTDMVLWLDGKTLETLRKKSIFKAVDYKQLFISSRLFKQDFTALTDFEATAVKVVHSFKLPGKFDSAFRRFQVWAKLRKIPITHPRYQAEAFFACFATNDALNHVRRYRVRDYFLDLLDHSQGLALYLPFYPQASMGPKQRFLSKGGYIAPLVEGKLLAAKAEFIEP